MAAPTGAAESIARITRRLAEVQRIRMRIHADPLLEQDRRVVRAWQAERMARTYSDLLAQPRYRAATRFFLDDVYGAKGYPMSDEDVARILPTMGKLLPLSALETIEAAIELDWLSERLDGALAQELRNKQDDPDDPLEISVSTYTRAYAKSGNAKERDRQFELICQIGRELDRLAAKPLVSTTLQLMRGPALLAGLQSLQQFLERGFNAFKGMNGAKEFLDTIAERERRISAQLFEGKARPFQISSPDRASASV